MGLRCNKCQTSITDRNTISTLYLLEIIYCDIDKETKQMTIGFVCRNCGTASLAIIKTTRDN